jgi:hypothetical protein
MCEMLIGIPCMTFMPIHPLPLFLCCSFHPLALFLSRSTALEKSFIINPRFGPKTEKGISCRKKTPRLQKLTDRNGHCSDGTIGLLFKCVAVGGLLLVGHVDSRYVDSRRIDRSQWRRRRVGVIGLLSSGHLDIHRINGCRMVFCRRCWRGFVFG